MECLLSSFPASGYRLWKRVAIFGALPAIILGNINAFATKPGHEEEERPEFVAYPYLGIRKRPFPWGDRMHTFFHNAGVNHQPWVGYEDDKKGWYWGEYGDDDDD